MTDIVKKVKKGTKEVKLFLAQKSCLCLVQNNKGQNKKGNEDFVLKFFLAPMIILWLKIFEIQNIKIEENI